jgi:hypothetical protein
MRELGRTEAAKIGGVTLQIVRDWVLKFNARITAHDFAPSLTRS